MISVGTALSLLVHMLVGCCWHHPHLGGEKVAPKAVIVVVEQPCHDCSHRECTEATCEGHDHEGQQCEAERCVAVVRTTVRLPWIDDLPQATTGTHVLIQSDRDTPWPPADPYPNSIAPPLRLHLMHQVLLT